MWTYSKKLQYPVKVKNTSPQMAKIIMTQLGGPDGNRYKKTTSKKLVRSIYIRFQACFPAVKK